MDYCTSSFPWLQKGPAVAIGASRGVSVQGLGGMWVSFSAYPNPVVSLALGKLCVSSESL